MGTNVSRAEQPHTVAKVLKVSVATLSRYAREGLIPFDLTPKGHRRYNSAEVVEALHSAKVQPLSVAPMKFTGDLVFGPAVVMSDQARMSQDLRAIRTTPYMGSSASTADQGEPESAFDEMINSARRIRVLA